MRSRFLSGIVILLCLMAAAPSILRADTIVINFEGLSDLESVTTQYPGLTFSNTLALLSITAGGSLNEIDFPPHSGVTVVIDDGGAISVSFATPILSFGGYFTYVAPLSLQAYDGLDNLLASAFSASSTNLEFYGGTPNEFIQVAFAGGISKVIITGDPGGGSFALDDATYTTPNASTVPEPSTILLVLAGVPVICLASMRRRGRSRCG